MVCLLACLCKYVRIQNTQLHLCVWIVIDYDIFRQYLMFSTKKTNSSLLSAKLFVEFVCYQKPVWSPVNLAHTTIGVVAGLSDPSPPKSFLFVHQSCSCLPG